MRLLLDTHAVIWWADQNPRFGAGASAMIGTTAAVHISHVSLWEIAIKISVGKLRFDLVRLIGGLEAQGAELLSISIGHCERYATLPLHHRDPFDRMLVAQAFEEDLVLMSDDGHLARYGVQTVPCG